MEQNHQEDESKNKQALTVMKSLWDGVFRYGLLTMYPAYLIFSKAPILFFGSQGAELFNAEWENLLKVAGKIAVIFTDHGNNFFYIFVSAIGIGFLGVITYLAKLLGQVITKLIEVIGVKGAYLIAKTKMEWEIAQHKREVEDQKEVLKKEQEQLRSDIEKEKAQKRIILEQIAEDKLLQAEKQQKANEELRQVLLQKTLAEAEVNEQKTKVEQAQKDLERKRQEISKNTDLIKQAMTKLQERQSDLERITDELKQRENQLGKVKEELSDVRNENQQIVAKITESEEARLKKMDGWFKNISGKLSKDRLIETLETKLLESQNQKDSLQEAFFQEKLVLLRNS